MKKFVKGRWFPLVATMGMATVVAFIMGLCGWRVTYAPELETSWDAISAIASLLGAGGTVAAVWFAVSSSNKQIKLSNKQQKQNTGLNLYPERRNALRLFSEKKYDDVYWDAVILFSPKVVEGISDISFWEKSHAEYCDLINRYEQEMENCVPELYEKYAQLKYIEEAEDEAARLCNNFSRISYTLENGDRILLDYHELDENERKTRLKAEQLHLEVFQLMKDEIKESIQ